jgi:hypothetical protein
MSTMDSPKATIKLEEQPTPLGLIELLWKGITAPGSPGEDMQVALGYGANDPHVSGERSGLPSP